MLTHLKTICITILLCISTAMFNTQPKQQAPDTIDTFPLPTMARRPEGFAAGTMVQTPSGYQPIEQLKFGDLISGKDQAQEILYLKQEVVDEYYIIQINQQKLNVGSAQQFCLHNGQFKTTDQLQFGDQLENGSYVYEIYHIKEPCLIHCLSTQDQSFYVYPDIYVHNFDVVTLGTASFMLSLSIIELSNPITLVVGGVLLLSWYKTQYFQKIIAPDFEFDDEDPDLTAENLSLHNHEAVHATRSYYHIKQQALIDTHKELTKIHANILATLLPNNNNILLFATAFLSPLQPKQYQQAILPDIFYEYNLSSAQKLELLKARDTQLDQLQEEIIDLHLIIAFYTNEAIERRNIAKIELDEILKTINFNKNTWNNHLTQIDLPSTIDHYFAELLWEHLLNLLETRTKETQYIFIYYQNLQNHFFTNIITNLQDIIVDQFNANQSIFSLIAQNRTYWNADLRITEKKLREYNVLSQQLINKIKNKIHLQQVNQDRDTLALAKAKHNAARNAIKNHFKNNTSQQTPNMKRPDKDPDDDWFEKLKKTAKRKALHRKFKKFYKDPQNDLWWSKDNGSAHAGPHFKVFQERATHLEWIRDIDLLGKAMDKHKGPIGKIIPYKELIFY